MKQCKVCKQRKDDDKFTTKNKLNGTTQDECKDCCNAYQREWYKKNTEIHKQRVSKVKEKQKTEAYKIVYAAKSIPCKDCGRTYPPYIMDFDHLPQYEKKYEISSIAGGRYPISTLKDEIAKCDVVCSNCHRERTHQRGYSTKRVDGIRRK